VVGQTVGGRDPNYEDKFILTVEEFRDKPARDRVWIALKTRTIEKAKE
jgi:hypothetical protein